MQFLLRDVEIEKLLKAKQSLIESFDSSRLGTGKSPVKGSTLDLTIGDIFVPGEAPEKLGGLKCPRSRLSLDCGQTAVIRSAEKLCLPDDIAGIGFPPSTKVSLAGLLSTNPGHVDPGYIGFLHLTVVNMGQEPFELERGGRFMRLMLFGLDKSVRNPVGEVKSPLTEELLDRLSHDFMDIDNRTKKAAKAEELSLRARQVWLTVASTIVAALLTAGAALLYLIASDRERISAQIAKIEGRMDSIGVPVNLEIFSSQLQRLNPLEDRLIKLETAISNQSNPKN